MSTFYSQNKSKSMPCTCCLCNKQYVLGESIEIIHTQRDTVLSFHTKCYTANTISYAKKGKNAYE